MQLMYGKTFNRNLLLQVKEINRDTLERYHHGAAALSVSSECVKVVLLGGVTAMRDNLAVLRFGMFCGDV